MGRPDANGTGAANFAGFVKLSVAAGDVALTASVTDVRCAVIIAACGDANVSAGPDYAGELRLSALVRATDKLNAPSPTPSGQGAATVQDVGFGPSIPCTSSPDVITRDRRARSRPLSTR